MKQTLKLSLLALAVASVNAHATLTDAEASLPTAVNTAGTDYETLAQEEYFDLGPVMEPMKMADMLMCIVGASGAPILANETYKARADFGLCGAGSTTETIYSDMTVQSTRASADAVQQANIWVHYKGDASAPTQDVHLKGQMTSSPTGDNQFGEWQLDWEFQNPLPGGTNNLENGHIKASAGSLGFGEFVLANTGIDPDTNAAYSLLAKIEGLSTNSGRARISTGYAEYLVAFDDELVFSREVDLTITPNTNTDSCNSLDPADLEERAFEYNLYDENGALVDISSEIEFETAALNRGVIGTYTYFDGTSDVVAYWAWIDNDDYPTSSGDVVVTDANSTDSYTISWTVATSGAGTVRNVTAVSDGTSAGSPHTFDKPIVFDTSDLSSGSTPFAPSTKRTYFAGTGAFSNSDFNDTMQYNGPGRLWGIAWNSGSPVSLADGTAMSTGTNTANDVEHRNKTYYVKAAVVAASPRDAGLSACSTAGLGHATALELSLPTSSDVSVNAPVLGTEPTVTGDPKIVDGVLQVN